MIEADSLDQHAHDL